MYKIFFTQLQSGYWIRILRLPLRTLENLQVQNTCARIFTHCKRPKVAKSLMAIFFGTVHGCSYASTLLLEMHIAVEYTTA